MKKELKIGMEVKVEWHDSHIYSGWEYGELIYDLPHCFTRGVLKYFDNDIVCVIPTTSDTEGKLGTIFIPRGAVISIKEMRES
ncbi:MAG: hypothetical protein PHS93_08900 [Candidatus Omnitrophica bacterium]|nr:hypothetical protein [Candidatus Omnitrophota bacterium]